MAKFFTVAWQEILYHLSQWSFYVTVLIMPLIFVAIGLFPQLQRAAEQTPLPAVETVLNLTSEELTVAVGVVDNSGIIDPDSPNTSDKFHIFVDEAAATAALEQGSIENYYVISTDYMDSGQVLQFSVNPQLLADTDGAVRALIRKNLLETLDDASLIARLDQPVELVRHGPPPRVTRFIPSELDMNQLLTAGLVVMLFVYVINVGGNLLLRALQLEARARVLEVIIVSTTPEQFIGGKLLALTTLTMAQAGLTLSAGALVYGRNPGDLGPSSLSVGPLALSIPYLVLGFLAYAGFIMGVAALWPNFRESAILLAGMRLLSLTPLLGVLFMLPNIDGPISVVFTIFPLTSHLLMPFRLFMGSVPWWQWGLGLALLGVWSAFTIWLSMRLFRLNGLLTGRALKPSLVWQALWS